MTHPLNLPGRLSAWWQARLKPVDHWLLTQRNIYILPTRAGLAFGLTLLLLLVASINYQLNLGFALTFLLAGSALVSMHMTHGSLRGLSLHVKPPQPAFAGGRAELELVVTNAGGVRHGLGFGVDGPARQRQLAWAQIGPQGQSAVTVGYTAGERGLHALPLLRAESRFPFGLFRAWTVWRPAGRIWVYPAPETPAAELPPQRAKPGGELPSRAASGGEFDGLRPWRRGDGLRQVVWKKVARTGELVSRDGRESNRQQLWLDWSAARADDPERRLSRLAAWVLEADARGLAYGLRLPGRELPADHGASQRHAALQALAEWA